MIRFALACLALILIMSYPALAGWPDPGRSLDELRGLFPSAAQLPAGATLVEEGTRSLDELAAGFPDPDDARQVLTDWGWSRTAYRVYVIDPAVAPRSTTAIPAPDRLEISLHQFATSSTIGSAAAGASYALPYFAHGRAVMLGQEQRIELGMSPCEAAVMGAGAKEYTYYVRSGSLLVRVTATTSHSEGALYYIVMPSRPDGWRGSAKRRRIGPGAGGDLPMIRHAGTSPSSAALRHHTIRVHSGRRRWPPIVTSRERDRQCSVLKSPALTHRCRVSSTFPGCVAEGSDERCASCASGR